MTFDPGANAGDCYYDPVAADRSVSFFAKALKHTKGSKVGQPFVLEEWQADYNRTLFGWKRADGTRRFQNSYVQIPRKNGKTTWIAGIATYVLFCEQEARAENYCAAVDRNQAGLLYNTAAAMIRANPTLAKWGKVVESQKRVEYKGSFLRAIPANEGGSHGFDAHLIAGDELHAWKGRAMYDVLTTSTGAREQPLILWLTTAGHDRQSICYLEYKYACGVRDGKIEDTTYLPLVYEAAFDDDWQSESVWRKSNPNYGVSVKTDYLKKQCRRAIEEPSFANAFRRLHTNQWTSQDVKWLNMDRWRGCRTTSGPIPSETVVFGGLDLSSVVDLSAWCELALQPGGGVCARWHFWMPSEALEERERRDRVPYSQWAKQGLLTVIPGSRINQDWIERYILERAEKYRVVMLGYDPWNAEGMMVRLNETYGITTEPVSQGYAGLSYASKEFEALIKSQQLDHGNHPMLEWMAEGVECRSDPAGNIRPVRPKPNSAEKMDGIAALLNALVCLLAAQAEKRSAYDDHGPLFA